MFPCVDSENARSACSGFVVLVSVTASVLVSDKLTVPPFPLTVLAFADRLSPGTAPALIWMAAPVEVPSALMFPPIAFSKMIGLLIAKVLDPPLAAMLPFSLIRMNRLVADEPKLLAVFSVTVSALGELSVIQSCPADELPVAVALSKSPAPPLFTSIAVLPEVPISPFWALKLILALVIDVFAEVLATILPFELVRLNRFVALDGEDELLSVSVSLALSVIHS